MRGKLAFNLAARLYNLSIGYGIVMLLTKNYSLKEYGEYALLLSIIAILDRFNNWGISKNIIFHQIGSDDKSKNSLLILITGITSTLLGIGLYYIFNPYGFELYSLIIILFSFSIKSLLGSMFIVSSNYRVFAFITNVFQVTVLLGAVLFSIFVEKIGIIKVYTFSEIVLIVTGLFLGFRYKVLQGKIDLSQKSINFLQNLYSTSWSYFLVDIIHMISVELDKIVIGLSFSPEILAPYSVAEKLARMSIVPLNNISAIIQGQVSKVKDNVQLIRELFYSYSTLAALCSLPVTFILVLFGKNLLNFIGKSYDDAYPILLVLLVARLGQYLTGFKAVLLQMTKYRTLEVFNNILKVVLMLGCFWVSVGYLGIFSMATSFLVGMGIISLIQVFQIKKKFGVRIINKSYLVLIMYLCLTAYVKLISWDWLSIPIALIVLSINCIWLIQFSKKIKEY